MAAERVLSDPELQEKLREVCETHDDGSIPNAELRRMYKSITNINVAVRARRADLIDTLCLLYHQIERPTRMGPDPLDDDEDDLPSAPLSTPRTFSEEDEDYDEDDEKEREARLDDIMNANVNVDDAEEGAFIGPAVPPGILYIRLHPAHDPLRALRRQDDLNAAILAAAIFRFVGSQGMIVTVSVDR